MVGKRGRPPKRKAEDLHEDTDWKCKTVKEAKIEAVPNVLSVPTRLALMTLGPGFLNNQDTTEEWNQDQQTASISEAEESTEGRLSKGTSLKCPSDPDEAQVILSCKRVCNGESYDCETQTFHFIPASKSELVSANSKATKDANSKEQEVLESLSLVCCVKGCREQSDTHSSNTLYRLPVGKDNHLWAEALDISCTEGVEQLVCSKHFIMPIKACETSVAQKGKKRKNKTCDMWVAEEAEKIKQGLASGRPKRTPKPNKNYNWDEVVPLIKDEPDNLEDEKMSFPSLTSMKEETSVSELKNKSTSISESENSESETEDEEIYLENISLPSNPRPPPPKSKGRPLRIRDFCTQTEGDYKPPLPRLPLREVKVQCNVASQPPSPCSGCSHLNWLRLEELLVECVTKIEGSLCAMPVQECLRKVVNNVPHPSHAANVLKMLCGKERDVLENMGDIVLMPTQEDEVEIENIIYTDVEEPITGMREITPRKWRRTKRKNAPAANKEITREEYPDFLGIEEATEIDDEEFHPENMEDAETEEEEVEEQEFDEDWMTNKQDQESRTCAKKQRKTQPPTREKKEHVASAGEEAREGEGSTTRSDDSFINPKVQDASQGRRRRDKGDTRWIRKTHSCSKCSLMFSTKRKFEQHFKHMHLGIAPWHGEHKCDDCGKVFTQKISLNVHRMFKHGAPRRYQCSLCVYEAPTKEYLKRHMKVHTNERRYVCPHCHKGLKTAESYRNHLVIHTNKGRFVCQVCHKAYNHKGAYQDHIRTHCDFRDYACDYCGAAFKAYKHVARHIRAVHLNDKRFICDVCGAQYMTCFNLKSHLKKHGDLSSLAYAFECPMCDAKFRGSQGCAVHLRVVHSSPTKPVDEDNAIDEEGGRLISPHPTRRPIQYHYSKIPRDDIIAVGVGDKSGREGESGGAIYLDNSDDFYLHNDREEEAVVYEVYSPGEEEELEELDYKEEIETVLEEENREEIEEAELEEENKQAGKDRVIHVYPCSLCHIMFTSKSALEHHHQTHQHQHQDIKSEPVI